MNEELTDENEVADELRELLRDNAGFFADMTVDLVDDDPPGCTLETLSGQKFRLRVTQVD